MRPINKEHQTFNSGVLFLGKIENIYDTANKKIGDNFSEIEKLFYSELTKRDQDLELANSLDASLDLKVKIPKRKINTKNKVKIDDEIYDIFKFDSDEFYIYLYLQVVKND